MAAAPANNNTNLISLRPDIVRTCRSSHCVRAMITRKVIPSHLSLSYTVVPRATLCAALNLRDSDRRLEYHAFLLSVRGA